MKAKEPRDTDDELQEIYETEDPPSKCQGCNQQVSAEEAEDWGSITIMISMSQGGYVRGLFCSLPCAISVLKAMTSMFESAAKKGRA